MPPKQFARRGGGGSGFAKVSFPKKRSSPDSEDADSRPNKKSKGQTKDEIVPLVPKIEVDDDENKFVAIKANGTRRVTVSDFKGKTLVSIREYYEDAGGDMKPGKKGIALTIDQYNAFLAAAPLLESVLIKRKETVARPEYNGQSAVDKDAGGEDEEEVNEDEDEEE
ncbi:unnamed protein product [Periconia digitata]|uniref:Transcriptional coactivator p15 (PC4) C-terminal domain-containing protein n=1 Tax=Periconia digitata TaxID=1303443 RepID=A0A9W4UI11_9PLEO|nr:unnamed protein product [Periconia digitata]